jgi:hypothetical protein
MDKLSAAKGPPSPAVVSPNGGAKGQAPGTKAYTAPRARAAKPPVATPMPGAVASVSPGAAPSTGRPLSVPSKLPMPADQFSVT